MGTPAGTSEWWDERATSRSWSVPGYTEVGELGRGACGTVVRARADHLGRDVAIKYLDPELLTDGSFRQAFRAEARLLARLDSPHIARLHEYVERAGAAAIVMELVEGASLRSTLARGGPVEPEAALSMLKGSLLGLGAAHAAGVVHRDYKPANVLVTGAGESVLVDFGIAARSGGVADGSGTPAYMAPEQWAGGFASPRGDTYAATVTFFECLTGRLPFPGTDLATLRAQHEHADVPVDVLPAAVRELARHGMAKDPAWRPADAEEFLDELEYAATAGYGEDWEERGRDALARRVALLLLIPSPPGAAGGTGLGRTEVRSAGRGSRRGSARAVLGTVVAVLICSGAVAVIAARKPPPEPELVPSVAVTTPVEAPVVPPVVPPVEPEVVDPTPVAEPDDPTPVAEPDEPRAEPDVVVDPPPPPDPEPDVVVDPPPPPDPEPDVVVDPPPPAPEPYVPEEHNESKSDGGGDDGGGGKGGGGPSIGQPESHGDIDQDATSNGGGSDNDNGSDNGSGSSSGTGGGGQVE